MQSNATRSATLSTSATGNAKMTLLMRLAIAALAVLVALAALVPQLAQAGGKGNKGKGGGQEDIIMYNGNIVLRGDESGGSIVMAGMHPTHEEVEFSPSFFTGGDMGAAGAGMGGFGRRRRR